MQQIIRYFWQICLFRKSPEDLPSNWFPTGLALAIYLLVATTSIILGNQDVSMARLTGTIFTGLGVEASVVLALLVFKGVPRRFPPAMAAMLGTNAIMLLVMLPTNVFEFEDTGRLIAQSVFLISLLWWLAIAGFILHKAANISLVQGVAVALASEMLALVATTAIFPINTP
jgi:hypothetical protein